ncbi:MAG: TonB-dependent receptor [Rubricoccaceae bacterium]|nr:TonB-dependent receptor [Rubricoccaceae bacterium]
MCRPTRRRLAAGGLLLAVLLLASAAPRAQSAALRGFVTDEGDGQPLLGVNVVLERDGALYGATTDTDGLYTVTGLAPGRYALRATFIGYAPHRDTLDLEPGVRTYSIALATGDERLDEVVVQSERASGAANVVAGLQQVRPEDIARVPAPDVSGDLANYLTTLPGVVTTGDQGGQVFIRGGEPSQNLVYLDGIPLYQPFHVLGFYSAFPTDVVAEADVYAGGYGARYGGQLSSVLDVSARTGNKRRFSGAGSVAPFVSTALVEGPLVPDRVSFVANGRLSVIEQGAANLVDRDLPYTFGDVFGKVHATPTESSQLSLTGIHTFDRAALGDTASVRPEEIRWSNTAGGFRFLFLPVNVRLLADVELTATRLNTEVGPPDAADRRSEIERFGAGFHFTYFLGGADLDFGGFLESVRIDSRLGGLYQNVEDESRSITQAGLYLEPEFKPGPWLSLRPGLRVTTSPSLDLVFAEPRLRVVSRLGPHQLSAAGGLYHQALVGLNDRRDITSLFTAWTTIPTGEAPRAWHAIGGYRVTPAPWLDLAVEGFYKWLENLSIPEWTATPRLTTALQPASGRAYGGDARVELRGGPFYGYVNYGYSYVRYEAEQAFYELWFGSERLAFSPPHDRRHQVNALLSATVGGFDLSARWQYGSGLPFSRALGFDVFMDIGDGIDPFTEGGEPRVIYERPYNSRLPAYHRLDLSAERTFDLGAADLTAQAGVINVYDRPNLFAFDLFTLRRSDQLPLVPVFGLKLSY